MRSLQKLFFRTLTWLWGRWGFDRFVKLQEKMEKKFVAFAVCSRNVDSGFSFTHSPCGALKFANMCSYLLSDRLMVDRVTHCLHACICGWCSAVSSFNFVTRNPHSFVQSHIADCLTKLSGHRTSLDFSSHCRILCCHASPPRRASLSPSQKQRWPCVLMWVIISIQSRTPIQRTHKAIHQQSKVEIVFYWDHCSKNRQ